MNNMTEGAGPIPAPIAPAPEAQTAGTRLRLTREAAGLSIDDVAQQLKLARRQVLAIENDDVAALPGPTFVRGFIRNYARLLRIDAAPLIDANRLAAAPPAAVVPVQPIEPATMSELPSETTRRGGGLARWLIPTGLVLLLAAGVGFYQFSDIGLGAKKAARKDAPETMAAKSSTAPAATVPSAAAPDASAPPERGARPAPAGAGAAPDKAAAGELAPVPGADAAAAAPGAASAPTGPGGTIEGRLELEFGGPSWVEVRDKFGDVLVSKTMTAKSRQTVRGEMPFTLRIGNASVVRVLLDGRPIDLSPHTRNEIARLVLPAQQP